MTVLQRGYVGEVVAGQGIDLMSGKIAGTWVGELVWYGDDGKREVALNTGNYWQGADPNKRRTRARLNIKLGRYRNYLKRTGERYEVVRERERLAERAAKKAAAEAKQRVRDAAPDLLDALEYLRQLVDPDVTPDAPAAIARADAAIAKAKGEPK